MKLIKSVIIFILIWNKFYSQNSITKESHWSVKPYFNYAAMIQHRSALGNLIKGYTKTYEVNIVKSTIGNKLWQIENNLPDIGVNASIVDYANPRELGYAIICAPFIEIPLNKDKKPSRLHLRLCWGPAYMTKHFDIANNQKNGAIGSKFNAYVQFKWFWQIDLNKNVRIEPGFMFSHISNGRAQTPNLGLNVFGFGTAINFNVNSKERNFTEIDSSTKSKSKHELFILNSYGYNDGEIQGRKYLTSCLSFNYNFKKRNTHKFGLGFDLFYEQNYIKDVKNAGILDPTLIDNMRFGPKIGYSYNVGAFSFPIEMGVYLRQVTDPDGLFFNRIGIRYFSKNGFMCAFGLRTHFAVAYNFDYGIGYRFNL